MIPFSSSQQQLARMPEFRCISEQQNDDCVGNEKTNQTADNQARNAARGEAADPKCQSAQSDRQSRIEQVFQIERPGRFLENVLENRIVLYGDRNEHTDDGGKDDAVDADELHQHKIADQIYDHHNVRAVSILPPNSTGVLICQNDLSDLINIKIHDQQHDDQHIQHVLLMHPQLHERLIQAQKRYAAERNKPKIRECQDIKIIVVFL